MVIFVVGYCLIGVAFGLLGAWAYLYERRTRGLVDPPWWKLAVAGWVTGVIWPVVMINGLVDVAMKRER